MKNFKDIIYIGVDDLDVDLFEGQYTVPEGMAYNSYIILDEKTAVMDTVDKAKVDEWLAKLAAALDGKAPDYIVISHMEPDHSAGIARFCEKYPTATVVGSAKAFQMLRNFYGTTPSGTLAVKEGDTLSLGAHTLRFIAAPMIHWPEVMMSYEEKDKILFAADAFGKFGALCNETDDWTCEARRYYFNIVGKYGAQVQAVLKKLAGVELRAICPLHGPVLEENLGYYVDLYDKWSSYTPEDKGTLIAYAGVYGNTRAAALALAEELRRRGEKVSVMDLARSDMAEAVEDAFRYDKTVFAATTLDGGIFPVMEEFIRHLKAKNFQNRKVGIIENGSWAPMSGKLMRALLEEQKGITVMPTVITLLSSVPADFDKQASALADELLAD